MFSVHYVLTVSLILVLSIRQINALILSCYAKTGNPEPEKIDPHLCTHILVIGNCTLDENGLTFPDVQMMQRYNKLKEVNPDLKVLVTLLPKNKWMSALVVNQTQMDEISQQVYNYLLDNQLDGFDIDWEFPVWSGDSKWTDRDGFSVLLKTLFNQFSKSQRKLLLTAAVVAIYNIQDIGYDAREMNKYLDFVQIMNYDFHRYSVWRPFTAFNAPLHKAPYEHLWFGYINSEYSTQHWLDMGIEANKLIFGIPVYGVGYELLNKSMHYPYSPAVGISKYGDSIPYRRSCAYAKMRQFKQHWDDYAKSPYLVNGRQWLGVEDKRSVQTKTQFARQLNLAGVMMFALDSDDYSGKCGEGLYPLTHAIKEALNQPPAYKFEFVKFLGSTLEFRRL